MPAMNFLEFPFPLTSNIKHTINRMPLRYKTMMQSKR